MKRHPKPLWDRQGQIIFRQDRHYKHGSPLRHGLPERSTHHSKKVITHRGSPKQI